ncbi:MAG: PEGA domain-containing protein [Opitutaceae bacterium]|nr:PEGA domain-containing protein [Opitutaceae bacterium]
MQVTSNPPGATAYVNDKPVGTTPTQVTLEGDKPVPVEFRLEGYFPESFVYQPGQNQGGITARLEPKTLTKTYDITSAPDGATLTLEGRQVGATPLSGLQVVYARDDKASPWREQTLVASKPNYQSENVVLGSGTTTVPKIELTLLKEDRVYNITAATPDGAELNADVALNGAMVGQTPLKLPVTFQRPNKSSAWPKFNLSVEVPAKYKPVAGVIDFARGTTIALKLQPIIEIATILTAPALVMTPTGVVFKAVQTSATGILSTRESAEIVTDLKPVTNFGRKDQKEAAATRAESINSFCVTPDGQHVIFALTEHDEQGGLYSNLFIKQADDAASGVARLTQGSRYWDTLPDIANDGSNYLVFASNRSDRNKPDIFRVSLIDNRLSGGISRLTNDTRFNFAPTYGDSNRQLFYLSTEPNFPLAESQVSSIRFDGSLPTQLPINASEINNTFAEKVFFVKLDEDSKKKQIYSITADGKLETALINQEDFRKSHCFNPAVSPDGTKVLLVSDHGVDEQGRHNNDIYLVNADGTNLQRLTQNGSDDIRPAWSPSEEGVVFFLSNRGGAYNIWRMKLSGGSK